MKSAAGYRSYTDTVVLRFFVFATVGGSFGVLRKVTAILHDLVVALSTQP